MNICVIEFLDLILSYEYIILMPIYDMLPILVILFFHSKNFKIRLAIEKQDIIQVTEDSYLNSHASDSEVETLSQSNEESMFSEIPPI